MTSPTTQRLRELIHAENQKIIGEAIVTAGVGIVTSLMVFGGVFAISWLTFFLLHGIRIGSTMSSALTVTGVFILVSILSAWRKHDPFQHVEAMNQDVQDIQLTLGYAMGVPVINRQSLAGIASLLIGGPANLMEAWSIWQNRLRVTPDVISTAADLLQQCQRSGGVRTQPLPNPLAAALLYRLGLIKSVQENKTVLFRVTTKGNELLTGAPANLTNGRVPESRG